MRRAEWRQDANDRHGLPLLRTWAGDALRLTQAKDLLLCIAILVAAVTVFALIVALIWAASHKVLALYTFWALTCAVLIAALSQIVLRRLRRGLRGKPPRIETALSQQSLSPPDTFPVYVSLRYKGALTGLDLAQAVFIEGWLYVEGQRSTFAIHAAEVRARRTDDTLCAVFENGQSVVLRLKDGQGTEYFRHAATLWAAERDHPEGTSVHPPLAVHPSVRAGGQALVIASGAGLIGLLVLAAIHALPGVLVVALVFLACADLGRSLVNLRRLDEADRRATVLLRRSADFSPPLEPGL